MNREATTTNATQEFREQASVVGEDVQKLGRIGRDVVQETYQAGRDKAQEMEQTLEGQIRRYPLRSMAIAAGTGLVIGILLTRR